MSVVSSSEEESTRMGEKGKREKEKRQPDQTPLFLVVLLLFLTHTEGEIQRHIFVIASTPSPLFIWTTDLLQYGRMAWMCAWV
jgi:hypothetical protein